MARASATYLTMRPEPQASEQDPESWLIAVRSSVRELSEQVPTDRWLGIGLSAMIPTLVTTDASGEPVRAAITWEDGRAETQAAALNAEFGSEQLYSVTGQVVDGRYLVPMLLRVKDADPERLSRSTRVLGAKDYLFWWLTGEWVTDPSTASGYGCYDLATGEWRSDILAAAAKVLDAPIPQLPDIQASVHTAPLTATTAHDLGLPSGLPIVLGAADSVLAALALGVSNLGDVAYIAGTSTVILAVSDQLVLDPVHRYLVTPMAEPGSWGLEMDLLATGSAVRRMAQVDRRFRSRVDRSRGSRRPKRCPDFPAVRCARRTRRVVGSHAYRHDHRAGAPTWPRRTRESAAHWIGVGEPALLGRGRGSHRYSRVHPRGWASWPPRALPSRSGTPLADGSSRQLQLPIIRRPACTCRCRRAGCSLGPRG